jgi:DUF1680 family protein
MNRREFAKRAGLISLAAGAAASVGAEAGVAEVSPGLSGGERAAVNRSSDLEERYALTLNRVRNGGSPAYSEEFLLEDVRPVVGRRFTEYSGDLSGRYIGAMAQAVKGDVAATAKLDSFVEKVIALQKPDGYFGRTFHYDKPEDADLALLWGNGRLLVGLVEYYRVSPSEKVLASARKLGDFLVRIGPMMLSKDMRDQFGAAHFASSYICWMQQTEGLAGLYALTRDERYRKLAEQIVLVTERRPSDHVHGYLTAVRGMVDLYAITGDQALLHRAEEAWMSVASSKDLLITGGVPEGWSPNNHRTEGCAECDWLRLSLQLWKQTGNSKYLAMAEKTMFNEFAFNQFATGDFGHHVYTATGLPAAGAVRAWWCCTLHGLRTFPDVLASASRAVDGKVYLDLPLGGRIDSNGFTARADSSLASERAVTITIQGAPAEVVPLRIRRPQWADGVAIEVNGRTLSNPVRDGYVTLDRAWKAGDSIRIEYAMALRKEDAGVNLTSYWYGPWLLGASSTENPGYFNELHAENKIVPGAVKPTATARDRRFEVPVAVTGFGYVPAEFPEQPGVVTLRALAEQTGFDTAAWEVRFTSVQVS